MSLLHDCFFFNDVSYTEVFSSTIATKRSKTAAGISLYVIPKAKEIAHAADTQHFLCAVSSIMRMIICNAGVVRNRIKGVCWAIPNLTIADPHEWHRRSLLIKATKKLASTLHEANRPCDPANTPKHHTHARFV